MTSSPKSQWDQNASPFVAQDVVRKSVSGVVDPTQFGKLFVYQYDIGDFLGSSPVSGVEIPSNHTFNDLASLSDEITTQQSFEGWVRYTPVGIDSENVVALKIGLRVDSAQQRDYHVIVTLNVASGTLDWVVNREDSGVVQLDSGSLAPAIAYIASHNVGIRFFVNDINDTDCQIVAQINPNNAGWTTVSNIRDNASPLAGDSGDTPYEWEIQTLTGHVYTSGQTLYADNLSFYNIAPPEALPLPSFVYFRTDAAGNSGTVFSTIEDYDIGEDELSVYRNGLSLVLSGVLGNAIDRFSETSSTSITLGQPVLPSEVVSMIGDPDLEVVTQQTGISGTSLTVPTHLTGQNLMMLYRNGILMTVGVAGGLIDRYNETTTTTVTLLQSSDASEVWRAEVYGTSPAFLEEITSISGTTITTANPVSASDSKLWVFVNGLLLVEGIILGSAVDRYQVTGANQITLEVPLVSSDRVTIIKRA